MFNIPFHAKKTQGPTKALNFIFQISRYCRVKIISDHVTRLRVSQTESDTYLDERQVYDKTAQKGYWMVLILSLIN